MAPCGHIGSWIKVTKAVYTTPRKLCTKCQIPTPSHRGEIDSTGKKVIKITLGTQVTTNGFKRY